MEAAPGSIDRQIGKQNVMYKGILCSLKKVEILTYATWMNLEDIMLSEIIQAQKDKYCIIPLVWDTQKKQIHRDRK